MRWLRVGGAVSGGGGAVLGVGGAVSGVGGGEDEVHLRSSA